MRERSYVIRLPSNLRQTTRVTDGGHTIRSVIAENRMLLANFPALSSIETELLLVEVLHRANMKLCTFCSCDLDLDPMTFIYEHDPYPLKISPETKKWTLYVEAFDSNRITNIHTDRQTYCTYARKITTPHREW